jgi:hypothetical protein
MLIYSGLTDASAGGGPAVAGWPAAAMLSLHCAYLRRVGHPPLSRLHQRKQPVKGAEGGA